MRRILIGSLGLTLMALAAAGCGNSGNSTSSAGAIAAQQNADDMAVQAVTGLAVVGGDVQNVFHDTPSALAARHAGPGARAVGHDGHRPRPHLSGQRHLL
jgi:hypothetical protein